MKHVNHNLNKNLYNVYVPKMDLLMFESCRSLKLSWPLPDGLFINSHFTVNLLVNLINKTLCITFIALVEVKKWNNQSLNQPYDYSKSCSWPLWLSGQVQQNFECGYKTVSLITLQEFERLYNHFPLLMLKLAKIFYLFGQSRFMVYK